MPDGGSERSIRSSNKSFGRIRPNGYPEVVAGPDLRSADEKLEALLEEHRALEKFKMDMDEKEQGLIAPSITGSQSVANISRASSD